MKMSMFLKNQRKKYLLQQIYRLEKKSSYMLHLSQATKQHAEKIKALILLREGWAARGISASSDFLLLNRTDELRKANSYEYKANSYYQKHLYFQSEIRVLKDELENI